MTKRTDRIGISQQVCLKWLEQTANLILAGNDKSAVKDAFQDQRKRNQNKAVGLLCRVWVSPPKELRPLRDDGLGFLVQQSSISYHHLSVVIHWGMVMAVYPFWSSVATQTGRLLRLQGFATEASIQRRIREQCGERETVFRAVRCVLRSFLDWGVIQEHGAKGVYSSGATVPIEDSRLIAWLAEASLHARANGSAPIKDLINSPSLFPFRINLAYADSLATESSRLDILRHGLDDDMVMLRRRV